MKFIDYKFVGLCLDCYFIGVFFFKWKFGLVFFFFILFVVRVWVFNGIVFLEMGVKVESDVVFFIFVSLEVNGKFVENCVIFNI